MYILNGKKQIDADIEFFKKRIKLYEDFLKVDSKTLWNKDISFLKFGRLFSQKEIYDTQSNYKND